MEEAGRLKIKFLIVVGLWLLLIMPNIYASQPSANLRNIDFNVEIVKTPQKIGDILEVSWSFTLNEEIDKYIRDLFKKEDSLSRIKAFFKIYPGQEYLAGDTLWIGDIEYGVRHSFSFSYKIKSAGKITGSPVVQIEKKLNGGWTELTRNGGKGFMIIVGDTAAPIDPPKYIEVIGNDTITDMPLYDVPKELNSPDSSMKVKSIDPD
jgi:hypothetical protein